MNDIVKHLKAFYKHKALYVKTGTYYSKRKNKPQYFYIFITGFMACGKTTLASILKNYLPGYYLDTDLIIQAREHMTITSIFNTKGEQYFRAKEIETIETLLTQPELYLDSSNDSKPVWNSKKHMVNPQCTNLSMVCCKKSHYLHLPELIIVSLGGGAIAQNQVRKILAQHYSKLLVVWLNVPYNTIVNRLQRLHDRPLFNVMQNSIAFLKLYKKRKRLYKYCHDSTMYSSGIKHWIQQ